MKQKPSTPDEWTIHAINIQGYFFESWCRRVVEGKSGWTVVSSNHPVADPHFNNESALDLRAHFHHGTYGDMTLLIECKKNNPEFTEWVFFTRKLRRPGELS